MISTSKSTSASPSFSEILTTKSSAELNTQNNDATAEGDHNNLLGYKLVGDNIDKNVRPRYYRLDKSTVSMHFYHSFAVQDRVDISSFSDVTPDLRNIPLLSIPVNKILPSNSDESSMTHNFAIIISRKLVDHLKYFRENYSDVTNRHIKHEYYQEMSQKSKTVLLLPLIL